MANMFHLTAPGGQKPDLESGNDEVNVTEIFKTLEKGKDVMTLVEGSPGIGKQRFALNLLITLHMEKSRQSVPFPSLKLSCSSNVETLMEI